MELRSIIKWGLIGSAGYFIGGALVPPFQTAIAGQKVLEKVAKDARMDASRSEITDAAISELQKVGLQDDIQKTDLSVQREDGKWIVEADYLVKRPLYKQVALQLEFSISSDRKSPIPPEGGARKKDGEAAQ